MVMGDPYLLQERPDISALLPESGGDREQMAAAKGPFCGLNAMAVARPISDLSVNHRWPQCPYSCGEDCIYGGVVGGFDILDLKESPQRFLVFQHLAAGADRFSPWWFFSPLRAQIERPLQRLLKRQLCWAHLIRAAILPADPVTTTNAGKPIFGS
jgi:hypothetical protein